jgi:hypothetical protein
MMKAVALPEGVALSPVRFALVGLLVSVASVAVAQPPQPPGSQGPGGVPNTGGAPRPTGEGGTGRPTDDPGKPGEPKAPAVPDVGAKTVGDAVVLVSDRNWRATANPPAGWAKPDFDDSKWGATSVINGPTDFGAHYALSNQFGLPTAAAWVWYGDGPTFALRRTFDAPKAIRRAELLLIADDEADLIVNGNKVATYTSANPAWGHRGGAAVIDLTPHLVPGQKNAIAAKVVDKGLAKGFALDLRVNAPPLIPRLLLEKPKPVTEQLTAEVTKHIKALDDREYRTREAATKELVRLAKAHGQTLYDPLQEVYLNGSPEAQWRAGVAFAVLRNERNTVYVPTGADGRVYFPAVDLASMRAWWKLPPQSNPVAYRHQVQAKALRDADPRAFDAAVRADLATATDDHAATLAAFVSNLELADLADVLTQTLEKRPKTMAGAIAASGLGRLGKGRWTDAQRTLLTEASESAFAPTARAAKAALAAAK